MKNEAVAYAIDWWKNRHAQSYFPAMEQHLNWKLYDAMPQWFLKYAKPVKEDNALEIGCGYGQWMAPLSQLVGSVYGFDLHVSLLEKFHEQMKPFGNAFMSLGDGTAIPFASNSFSLVYSISVFQHMPREIVRSYFHEARRVLHTGGRAWFHFRHADGIGEYSQDIQMDHTGDWSVGWTEDEVRELAAEARLHVEAIDKGRSLLGLFKVL